MARGVGEPRPHDPADRRVADQQLGHRRGVGAVAVHAHGQGLGPPLHQEAVHRAGHGADGVLEEGQPRGHRLVAGGHEAAHHVAVATEVLGGRVHGQVGAEGERLLQGGRGEGVVDGDEDVGPERPCRAGGGAGRRGAGQRRNRFDVDDAQQGVGGRLDPHQPGGGPQRRPHHVEVGEVDGLDHQAGGGVHAQGQSDGAAVGVVRQQDVVARGEEAQHGVGGRHPAGKGVAVGRAFEGGQVALQGQPARVLGAGVLEPAVLSDLALHERGGEVDRGDHGPRGRLGARASVHAVGVEGAAHRVPAPT